MKLRRFTVRRLMILVAVAGLAFGGSLMRLRRADFLKMAVHHEAKEARPFERGIYLTVSPEDHQRLRKQSEIWHGRLKDKYMRAARYPWLPVAPDPGEPE